MYPCTPLNFLWWFDVWFGAGYDTATVCCIEKGHDTATICCIGKGYDTSTVCCIEKGWYSNCLLYRNWISYELDMIGTGYCVWVGYGVGFAQPLLVTQNLLTV